MVRILHRFPICRAYSIREFNMSKVLMKGNEAIAEAAIRAGCFNYFAYPITPQSEVAEYLSSILLTC